MNRRFLDAALRYAAMGWPTFPCRPLVKTPLGVAAPNGCKSATTDPEIITGWWTRYPSANVAVATGAPGPDVVDVDAGDGKPGPASFVRLRDAGLLRGAFAVHTTPGGGWHLLFAGTSQGNSSRARHGIDFRGLGGYIVAPPSVVGGREYTVAEYREPTGQTVDWAAIRDFLDPPQPLRQFTGERIAGVAALVRWLEERPPGDRNAATYWAALRALEGGASDDDLDQLRDAVVRAGHNYTDATRTVESARRRAGAAG